MKIISQVVKLVEEKTKKQIIKLWYPEKVEAIVSRHKLIEKELSSGTIDPKITKSLKSTLI